MSAPAENMDFNDINLDMDPAEERKFLDGLAEGNAETSPEESKEEPKAEEPKAEEPKEEPKAEEPPVEEPKEEIKAEEPPVEEPKEDEAAKLLEELRAERDKLQQQMNDITASSVVDRRKIELLEQNLKEASQQDQPQEEKGPTIGEIIEHVDARVNELDAALVKVEAGEITDVSAADLRKELRKMERYYIDLKAQQLKEENAPPNQSEIVQQAALEAQLQTKFANTKTAVFNEYPMLDPANDAFDEKMRDMVHRIYNPMIKDGADPVDALIEATTLTMRANGIASTSEQKYLDERKAKADAEAAEKAKAEEEAAAKAAAEKETANKEVAKSAGDQRKEDAVKRNLKAAADTAPDISSAGDSNKSRGVLDKYDFDSMTVGEALRISDDEEEMIEEALRRYNDY